MAEDLKPPIEEDIRFDDEEFNPALEPTSAKAWLNLLLESEEAFESWNMHCDNIDKQFANMEQLALLGRDKQFAMFWANCEVIKPAIYAKPPIPVVVPKFKDRRPVYQAASEVMERCAVVAFDLTRIDDLMLLIRDDLAMASRGVAWCRYESGSDGAYDHEKVCIDFKNRRDFLHSISRNWREVTWVAAASYLTRSEARARFHKVSGDIYQEAEYKVDKEAKNVGGADNRERAKFWEIWDKPSKRVVWVAEGVEDILDEDDAHLDLQNYFPCPKPAYGTLQRGSLVPVPDVLQYKDQLEEINLLTGRIHALSDALEAKGFYPAGGAELADAVQAAVATKTPGRLLVPISNWASFGGSKEIIIWLPIDMIATTIQALVLLRKQVIEDIYQITGIADIMRGETDPNETLGAQQLKTQNGSSRIRDKQQELVRLARDLVEITSEIITEKFDPATIVEMSQTQLPTSKMKQQQMGQIQQGLTQLQQHKAQLPPPQQPPQEPGSPEPPEMQTDPQSEQIDAMIKQGMTEMQKISEQPTIDQVLYFLQDNRAKAFVLDIETDSTIMADENAEKQRHTEFVQVLGNILPQLSQMITTEPSTAEFCGEILKFATRPFRTGRTLDGAIDELVELMKAKAEGPRPEDPATMQGKIALQVEQLKQQTVRAKNQQDAQFKLLEMQQKDKHKVWELQAHERIEMQKAQGVGQDNMMKVQVQNQKLMENRESHQAHMIEKTQDMQLQREKANMAQSHMAQQHVAKQNDMASRASERQMMAQQKAAQQGIVR